MANEIILSAIVDWRKATAALDKAQAAQETKAERLWATFCAAGIDSTDYLRAPKKDEKQNNRHVAAWADVKDAMTVATFGELVAAQIKDGSIGEQAVLVAASGRNKALSKGECKMRTTAEIARLRKQIVAMLAAKDEREPRTPKHPQEQADDAIAKALAKAQKSEDWNCDVAALVALLTQAQAVIRRPLK